MAIWNILRTLGIFYDHLVYFVFVWYIFPVLVSFTMKHLATLHPTSMYFIDIYGLPRRAGQVRLGARLVIALPDLLLLVLPEAPVLPDRSGAGADPVEAARNASSG
jgi:hypothetical protein